MLVKTLATFGALTGTALAGNLGRLEVLDKARGVVKRRATNADYSNMDLREKESWYWGQG